MQTALNAVTHRGSWFTVRYMGVIDYEISWRAMKDFTNTRTSQTSDEIWLLQHPAVYTQGIAGKPEHLLADSNINVIKTDRGGQITYHGPGQLIAYLLLDIRRLNLTVRDLVRRMETAVIHMLNEYQIKAYGCADMPGVYVGAAKIASLGLKIKKSYCYHGIALNVDMDLKPFSRINPCGYAGLAVTRTKDQGVKDGLDVLSRKLSEYLQKELVK
ncbi:lipoyl(octanoyl) transferase LipB [Nitrosomonas marina]|nr:lipoyl(octanoyl) transferase LipB [Nitrosomonas marina]